MVSDSAMQIQRVYLQRSLQEKISSRGLFIRGTVSTCEEFPYIEQRRIGREIAGRHKDIIKEGIGDLGNAVRNCFADLRRVTAEYGVDHIHIAGRNQSPVVEPVCFTDGHTGIYGNAVSIGFRVQFYLRADIAALVKEAAETLLPYLVKEPSLVGEDYIAVQIERYQRNGTIGYGNTVNESLFHEGRQEGRGETYTQFAYGSDERRVRRNLFLEEIPVTEDHGPGERPP